MQEIISKIKDEVIKRSNEFESITKVLLTKYNYPSYKIELIVKCILNHSNKRKEFRTTKEESILVDADALAHFDSIKSLYSLAYNVMELNQIDSINFIKDKLTKDYNEVSIEAKKLINDKYNSIMNCKNIKELENFF